MRSLLRSGIRPGGAGAEPADPLLLVIAAFTFVYLFIPNTRVRFVPALIGGTVGGIVWQTAGWVFAIFAASSNSYAAIYSGFAILLLFMIWLYLSWLVLLFGASIAFYVQRPEYLYSGGGEPRLSIESAGGGAVCDEPGGRAFPGCRPAPSMPEFTRALASVAFTADRHPGTPTAGALVPSDTIPVVHAGRSPDLTRLKPSRRRTLCR